MAEEDRSRQLLQQREFEIAQIRQQLGDRLRTDPELIQQVVEELALATHDHGLRHARSRAQCLRAGQALHSLLEPLGFVVRRHVVHAASRIPESGNERGWQVGDTVDWGNDSGYSSGDPSPRTDAINEPNAPLFDEDGLYRAHLVWTVEAPPGTAFGEGMRHLLVDATIDQFDLPVFGINLPGVLVTPFDLDAFLAGAAEKQRQQQLTIVVGDAGGYVGYVAVDGAELRLTDDDEALERSAEIARLARLRMSARGLIEARDLYPDYAAALGDFGTRHKGLVDEERGLGLDVSWIALDDELRRGIDDVRRLYTATRFCDLDETDALADEVLRRYNAQLMLRMATVASSAEGGVLSNPEHHEVQDEAFAAENREKAKRALVAIFADLVAKSPAFAAAALVVPNGLRDAPAARVAIAAAEQQRERGLLPYVEAVADEVRHDPKLYQPGGLATRRAQRRNGMASPLPTRSFLDPTSFDGQPQRDPDERTLGNVLDVLEAKPLPELAGPQLRARQHLQNGDAGVHDAIAELNRPTVRRAMAAAAAADPALDAELRKVPILGARVAMTALRNGQPMMPGIGKALLEEIRHPDRGPAAVSALGDVAALSNLGRRTMANAAHVMMSTASRGHAGYADFGQQTLQLWDQRPLVPPAPASLFRPVDTRRRNSVGVHHLGLQYWASIQIDRLWRTFHDRVDATLAGELVALPPEQRVRVQERLRAALTERSGDVPPVLAIRSLAAGRPRPDDPPQLALPPSGPRTPLPKGGAPSMPGVLPESVESRGSDSQSGVPHDPSSSPPGRSQTPAGRGSHRASSSGQSGSGGRRRRGRSRSAVPPSAAGIRSLERPREQNPGPHRAPGPEPAGRPAPSAATAKVRPPAVRSSPASAPQAGTSGRPDRAAPGRPPAVESGRTPSSSTPSGRVSGRPASDGRQRPALGRPTPNSGPASAAGGTAGPA